MYRKMNARQQRSKNGWKQNSPSRKNRRSSRDDNIDINRFINKAVEVKPQEAYRPQNAFSDFAINEKLKQSISRRGFGKPTPIQDQAIPPILAGRDVVGLANTGTGKTAAFLIPMIDKILVNPEEKVLVVVPTRELAIQIEEEFQMLSRMLHIFSVVIVGGANIQKQIRALQMRNNIVIGTPGRLKDLITRKVLNLSRFNNVILDEADRMLDMGFINDVQLLLTFVAPKRQTLLFSATFGREIESLVNKFLINPKKISIASGVTPKQIDQDIIRITNGMDKAEVLQDLLIQSSFEKVLIFTRTKHGADKLCHRLSQRGFKSESIHGDKPHGKRQQALKLFKDNSVNILVATDVIARGLDIPNVSHVINFDLPMTYDDYVHRIGRTGRAGQKGTALTFVG